MSAQFIWGPGAEGDPVWGLFDAQGLQGRYLPDNEQDPNAPARAEQEAFRALNANRDDSAVYVVQLRWSNPQEINTWYEVGDRVYAPMGEDADRTPPE